MHDSPLQELARDLAEVSPAWASVVAPGGAPAPRAADVSRDPPVVRGIEAIREGWLLHRGASRLVADASPDLELLMGDWSFAHGLCDVAHHGSLDDVTALAELVAELSTGYEQSIRDLEPHWDAALDTLT